MRMMEDQLLELGMEKDSPIEEQKRYIKETLEYEKFSPSIEDIENPCETSHTYTNPAIEAYCSELDWEDGWTPIDNTKVLSAYPEYIPTDEAVDTLSTFQPIIEIGAGSGYWAYVLKNAGLDIIATDLNPIDVLERPDDYWEMVGSGKYNNAEFKRSGPNSVEPSEFSSVEDVDYPNLPWTDVMIADHTVVQNHPHKTIMSCHPPGAEWTEELLELLESGQMFVFIGGWYPSADATPLFFNTLKNWDLVDTFPVYNWKSTHAHGYIFQKP